jgi:hypothetical protein
MAQRRFANDVGPDKFYNIDDIDQPGGEYSPFPEVALEVLVEIALQVFQ